MTRSHMEHNMSTASTVTVSRRVSLRRRASASATIAAVAAGGAASGASSFASATSPVVVASASTRTTTGRARAGSAAAEAAASASALLPVPMTPPTPATSGVDTTTRRRTTVTPPWLSAVAASAEPPARRIRRHTSRYFPASSPAPAAVESSSPSTFSGSSMRRRSPRSGAVVLVTPLASSSSSSSPEDDAPPSAPVPTGGKGGGKKKRKSPHASSESESAGEEIEVEEVERTSSFGPLWAGSLRTATVGTCNRPPPTKTTSSSSSATTTPVVPVHTLILGTHPSVRSLSETQYYAHPMNAFWWIAGDALGFRRDSAVSPSSGRPYRFAYALRRGAEEVIPYDRQVEVLTSAGFALWDLIGSCRRAGSLDQDITEEVPNDVRSFCSDHPEVRRIVLANGASKQLQLFLKHFRDWWDDEGEEGDGGFSSATVVLVPGVSVADKMSKRYARRRDELIGGGSGGSDGDTIGRRRFIEVEAPMSVSPAAAKFTYEEKRDDWERWCYGPGLRDRERLVEGEEQQRRQRRRRGGIRD